MEKRKIQGKREENEEGERAEKREREQLRICVALHSFIKITKIRRPKF